MQLYKFLKKGTFESLEKFEKKVNEEARGGWKVINFAHDYESVIVLFERVR